MPHADSNDRAPAPELACVVLAVGGAPEAADAARSLAGQSEPMEIVVVNSGGGTCAHLHLPDDTRVVHHESLLFPGAARNAGVAATRAPWVSFLAADCIAEPGWAAARLRAHRAGAAAVASAVTNLHREDPPAWASYIALFSLRMPGTPAAHALHYGASYARTLLEASGGFRPDLRTGEDTELHARLAPGTAIAWEPAVRTAHRHPRTVRELLADQRRRGGRSAAAWRTLGGPRPSAVALNALRRAPRSLAAAWRHAEPGDRHHLLLAAPLVPLAALAYAAGALGGLPSTPADGAGA